MTSKEIEQTRHFDRSANEWLKEIAYQLALQNEKQAPNANRPLQKPYEKTR